MGCGWSHRPRRIHNALKILRGWKRVVADEMMPGTVFHSVIHGKRVWRWELGKWYTHDGPVEMCRYGFHFCTSKKACDAHYNPRTSVLVAVEATDWSVDNIEHPEKVVCQRMRIVSTDCAEHDELKEREGTLDATPSLVCRAEYEFTHLTDAQLLKVFRAPDIDLGRMAWIAAANGAMRTLKLLLDTTNTKVTATTVEVAATNGHLEVVRYLVGTKGVNPRSCVVQSAALNGHLDVVQYLVDTLGVNTASDPVSWAASSGHMDVVVYLVDKGFVPTVTAVGVAAYNGHLDILMYLVENKGLVATSFTIEKAANYGRLDVIKYLVDTQGIVPTAAAVERAAVNGYLAIVQYLVGTKGVVPARHAVMWAEVYGHTDIADYLRSKYTSGVPF